MRPCWIGFPELGFVCISEIEEIRGGLGLPVDRDLYFKEAVKCICR
ncbi:DUF2958 domain-containing protein [Rhodocytophaga aerolata]